MGVIFLVLFSGLGLRAVKVQLIQGEQLAKKAADQYECSLTRSGKRGVIFDRHHRELAVSIKVPSICAYPRKVQNLTGTSEALAHVLNMDRDVVLDRLSSQKSFVWIKRYVNYMNVQEIKKLNLAGIGFVMESRRYYPNKGLAAQVIGFTGIDGHGLEGLEYYYESYLKGKSSIKTILRDALGRTFTTKDVEFNPPDGFNLILNLDKVIQYIAEDALAEAVKTYLAVSGIVIVVAPDTGAILAIAHYPSFNPNIYNEFPPSTWRNRAVSDTFEPGSTMKTFVAIAALESGVSTPESMFYCEKGRYPLGRYVIHDLYPHGWLSLQEIIRVSSNIGAVKVGQKVGNEKLYRTLKGFGFGEKTGIDCPGEAKGLLRDFTRWSSIDAGAICFGQGISVSPIQLTMAYAAIANKGIMMKPRLVSAIIDNQGRIIKRFNPQKIRRVVSENTATTVTQILKQVVMRGGTGVKANLTSYTVAGKTGTAQKVSPKGGYEKDKNIVSFVGFVPADDPKLVILVLIDEPRKCGYGGVVAAPVFKRIAQETLHYLSIPPERNVSPLMVKIGVRESG